MRELAEVVSAHRHKDLRRHARSGAVVLDHERLEHSAVVLTGDVLQVEAVAVDHLPVAERKDLNCRAVVCDREPDHVHRPHGPPVGRLPLGEVPDREQAVAVARRLLEPLVAGSLSHPLLELVLDGRGVTRQEPDDAVHDLPVVLLRDRSDARGEAAVDVEVEARDSRVPPRARALARPEAEDPVEDVERLPNLLRVRVRAEVDGVPAVPLTREHDARVLVCDGHGDVRERLVVAKANVEGRAVPLDEVLLEVERLRLRSRHDHLDVRDPPHELRGPRTPVSPLEVTAHTVSERLRLPHVEHLPRLVAEEVDAGSARQRAELVYQAFTHAR